MEHRLDLLAAGKPRYGSAAPRRESAGEYRRMIIKRHPAIPGIERQVSRVRQCAGISLESRAYRTGCQAGRGC